MLPYSTSRLRTRSYVFLVLTYQRERSRGALSPVFYHSLSPFLPASFHEFVDFIESKDDRHQFLCLSICVHITHNAHVAFLSMSDICVHSFLHLTMNQCFFIVIFSLCVGYILFCFFLVADTQLYKRLCPSIHLSIRWSVGPSIRRH